MKTIIFPSDDFYFNQVEEAYKKEYETVLHSNQFEIVLFSYDTFLENGKLYLNHIPETPVCRIYRG